MKMNKIDFKSHINNYCANVPVLEDIYVIFKSAYREIDLEKEKYSLELLEFDGDLMEYVWLNDWDEGQKFIDLFGIYTSTELLELIISPKNAIENIKNQIYEMALNNVGVLGDISRAAEHIAEHLNEWSELNENH